MIGLRSRRALVAALVALPLAGMDADAQALSLHGGARMYDEGSTPMVALRTEFRLPGPLRVEFSGSIADPVDDAPRSAASLLEAQLQVEVPLGAVITPYVGAGAGVAKTYTLGVEDDGGEIVYSLGVGARAAFSEHLALVVDARFRDFSTANGDGHTDVSVGLRYQFLPRFRGAPRR